jgi:hypothetical protein
LLVAAAPQEWRWVRLYAMVEKMYNLVVNVQLLIHPVFYLILHLHRMTVSHTLIRYYGISPMDNRSSLFLKSKKIRVNLRTPT